jgi:transcriptional regulator with XRE-family HTH domain
MPIKNIKDAVRELRKISEESQQFFGTRLRISTRALQLYESGERIPEPRQLVAFAAFAESVQRSDLTELFIRELERQLQPPPGYEFAVVFRPRDDVRGIAGLPAGSDLYRVRGLHGRKK